MSNPIINGHEIPTRADTNQSEEALIGAATRRALDGTLLSSVRARKESWQIETIPLEYAESEMVRRLLRGDGHSWDFEDAGAGNAWQYSSRGGPAASSISANTGQSTARRRFGSASLRFIASGGTVDWPIERPDAYGDPNAYTALWWDAASSGAWVHHVWRAQPGPAFTYWENGVQAPSPAGWRAVCRHPSDSLFQIYAYAADIYVDDVVYFPYAISDEMIASFYGFGEAFSALPRLKLDGDLVGDVQRIVRCVEPLSLQHKGLAVGGAWQPNMRRVVGSLSEV